MPERARQRWGGKGGGAEGVGICLKWGKACKRRGETEGRKWKRRKRNDVQEEADAIKKITSRDLKKNKKGCGELKKDVSPDFKTHSSLDQSHQKEKKDE